jgi:hypothetical protein
VRQERQLIRFLEALTYVVGVTRDADNKKKSRPEGRLFVGLLRA